MTIGFSGIGQVVEFYFQNDFQCFQNLFLYRHFITDWMSLAIF